MSRIHTARPGTVLKGADVRLPARLVRFLFGDFTQVYLLKPGQTVKSGDVKEVKEGRKEMKISYGNSRMEKTWKNNDISQDAFCQRVSQTKLTTETVEEYSKMTKAQQDQIKDVGGYVAGHLKDSRRKNGTVLSRSMLTLDMDHGTPDIADELEMLFGYKCCIYSTHKHTPEEPRFRLIIPLSRDVSEEEYPAVARKVAQEIGVDMFDDTTYQPHRLMYWPSTSANGEFVYKEIAVKNWIRMSIWLSMTIGMMLRHGLFPPDSPGQCKNQQSRLQIRLQRKVSLEYS